MHDDPTSTSDSESGPEEASGANDEQGSVCSADDGGATEQTESVSNADDSGAADSGTTSTVSIPPPDEALVCAADHADATASTEDVSNPTSSCGAYSDAPPTPLTPTPSPAPTPMAHIAVHVQDSSGKPIPGVAVAVESMPSSGPLTDNLGNWDFGDVTPDTYTVTGTKDCFTPTTASQKQYAPAGVSTQYQLVLTPLQLEIVDRKTGSVVSGTTVTRIVGQKIELEVRSKPSGHPLTDIQWTIPSQNVKSYTQSNAAGTVLSVEQSDKNKSTIDFYWIDGGSKSLNVSAKVDGCPNSASVTFNVLRPTMDTFTITTSSVNVTSSHFASLGNPVLCAFNPPSSFGSQWYARVTAPPDGKGEIGFTQKIEVKRRWVDNAGIARRYHSNGILVLDNALGIQYSGSQPINSSSSTTLSGNAYADSPWIPLRATDQQASADEQFDLYLMYKHHDADSIWVTLGKTHWDWGGATTRNVAPGAGPNTWTAPTGTHLNPPGKTNGANSTELPEWTGNFGTSVWSSP